MNINSRPVQFTLIILMNLVPVYGMFFLGWSIFSILYLFWLETLIVSLFNAVKIGFAGKGDYSRKQKTKIITTYLIGRTVMFFFYLVFILIFVGMIVAKDTEEMGQNIMMFAFQDTAFNLAILGFIITYGFDITFNYLMSGEATNSEPIEFNNLFDFRTIIIHIAVVLGGVGYDFMKDRGYGAHGGVLIYLTVFIVLKTAYDLFLFQSQKDKAVKSSL